MNLLFLGGTRFVGRHMAAAALARGHRVTLFHRGETNPGLFPDVEEVRGDRARDLSLLAGRRWDAAVDTSGYVPRLVRASAEVLAGAVERYVFISTISVYASFAAPGLHEESPLKEPPPGAEGSEEVTNESYGWQKALCERAVEEVLPGRALVVRPGLVVGPHDYTGRFTAWPRRVALGGEVLAPGRAERPVQVIDARDLGEWVVRMIERRATGTWHATGPDYPLTMSELLETCRAVTGGDARFTWVSEELLRAEEVDMPLWVPEEEAPGFNAIDARKARSAGLTFRPLAETVRDVLPEVAADPRGHLPLPPEREAELLAAWHARA